MWSCLSLLQYRYRGGNSENLTGRVCRRRWSLLFGAKQNTAKLGARSAIIVTCILHGNDSRNMWPYSQVEALHVPQLLQRGLRGRLVVRGRAEDEPQIEGLVEHPRRKELGVVEALEQPQVVHAGAAEAVEEQVPRRIVIACICMPNV